MGKKIMLDIGTIVEFYNIATSFPSSIDLSQGKYVVDGKSLLGLHTLSLGKETKLTLHSDNATEIKRFDESTRKYEM